MAAAATRGRTARFGDHGELDNLHWHGDPGGHARLHDHGSRGHDSYDRSFGRTRRAASMNYRLSVNAAVAVILTSLSLSSVIKGANWFVTGIGAVAVVVVAGILTRQ